MDNHSVKTNKHNNNTNTTTTNTTNNPDEEDDEREPDGLIAAISQSPPRSPPRKNFLAFSLLISLVPASALVCLALAAAKLKQVGAETNGILYAGYTVSSIGGATTIVRRYGSKTTAVLGMSLYCTYIACFWITIVTETPSWAYAGATVGGLGAGLLWTAQGVYFAQSIDESSGFTRARLAGIFATCLLAEETILDILSTVLTRVVGMHWSFVFGLYAILAITATFILQYTIFQFPKSIHLNDTTRCCQQSTAALQLLMEDSKAKYLWGFHAAFGLSGAFLNSAISAHVAPIALQDPTASYVGLLVAVHGGTAALVSWAVVQWQCVNDGALLCTGSICLGVIAWPFLFSNDFTSWGWGSLLLLYILHGVGRATYEGTLKSILVQFFGIENREAAFSMNVLMNGSSSALGWWLSGVFVRNDDVSILAWCTSLASLCGVLGYLRGSFMFQRETAAFLRRLESRVDMDVFSDTRNKESSAVSPRPEVPLQNGDPDYTFLETEIS